MFNIEKVDHETYRVSFKNENDCAIKKLFPKEKACSTFLAKLDFDADCEEDGWVDLTKVDAFFNGMDITNMMNENCSDHLWELYDEIKNRFLTEY